MVESMVANPDDRIQAILLTISGGLQHFSQYKKIALFDIGLIGRG